MNKLGHSKQLKNILMFEAETEREIRADITDKISRNTLKKHEHNDMTNRRYEGEIL